MAGALFGIDWSVYTARDVGTYGFAGGNAIVDAPRGFRQVPHWDRRHHPREYYARARALEEAERGYFTDEKLRRATATRFAAAEAPGASDARARARRPTSWRALAPRLPGRNDLCLCGSGEKFKKCCAARTARSVRATTPDGRTVARNCSVPFFRYPSASLRRGRRRRASRSP